jgi:hypothetical protein
MPTTVGNEANANGGTLPTIKFSVDINATQASYEKDSYDASYDNNASVKEATDNATISWFDNSDTTSEPGVTIYTLSTANDLAGLAVKVNGGNTFEGCKIVLADNINLPGTNWTPIGTTANLFKGTFDGQGHTVSNLLMNDNDGKQPSGLFGAIGSGSKITNVKVTGSITLASENPLSGVNTDKVGTGGICGYAEGGEITKCTSAVVISSVDITTPSSGCIVHVGGILGYGTGGTKIENCLNEGNITGTWDTTSHNQLLGGITSDCSEASGSQNVHISYCINAGSVTVNGKDVDDNDNYAGALIGNFNENPDIKYSYSVCGKQLGWCETNSWDTYAELLSLPSTVSYIEPDKQLSQNSYETFDFTSIWQMGSKYPVIASQSKTD